MSGYDIYHAECMDWHCIPDTGMAVCLSTGQTFRIGIDTISPAWTGELRDCYEGEVQLMTTCDMGYEGYDESIRITCRLMSGHGGPHRGWALNDPMTDLVWGGTRSYDYALDFTETGDWQCPVCDGVESEGHEADCPIGLGL